VVVDEALVVVLLTVVVVLETVDVVLLTEVVVLEIVVVVLLTVLVVDEALVVVLLTVVVVDEALVVVLLTVVVVLETVDVVLLTEVVELEIVVVVLLTVVLVVTQALQSTGHDPFVVSRIVSSRSVQSDGGRLSHSSGSSSSLHSPRVVTVDVMVVVPDDVAVLVTVAVHTSQRIGQSRCSPVPITANSHSSTALPWHLAASGRPLHSAVTVVVVLLTVVVVVVVVNVVVVEEVVVVVVVAVVVVVVVSVVLSSHESHNTGHSFWYSALMLSISTVHNDFAIAVPHFSTGSS